MTSNEDWYQIAKNFKIDEIPYENFSKGLIEDNELGSGAFGIVYKTTCEPIGLVAIKKIHHTDDVKKIINELKIHHRMDHERIIKFHGISRNVNNNKKKCYLVLECADQGDLRSFLIDNKECLNWEEKRRLAIQIVEGLHYLHETLNIAHRDLRTENILVKNGNIKIADFGLSKNLGSKASSKNSRYGELPFIDIQKLIKPDYRLDKRSDIYSLGVVLWEISSCHPPFSKIDDNVVKENYISRGFKEKPVEGTPIEYVEIYTDCWKLKPDSRPSIKQVFSRLQSMQSVLPIQHDSDKNLIEYLDHDVFEIWVQEAITGGFITNIRQDELTEIKEIGERGFGKVCRAHWSKTNDYIVFKELSNSNTDIQHEIQMQNKGHGCDNVIRFLGVIQEPQNDRYCIVMEYANEGDLPSYLKAKFSSLTWNDKFRLASNIASGVHYLHMSNIIHRDLHSKNIVIRKGIAKITDFGLAKSIEIPTTSKDDKVLGMFPYIAPELFKPEYEYSKETDIYSLGVLLWVLSSGYQPFKEYEANALYMYDIMNYGKREKIIPDTPSDYSDLYTACWNGNPKERPSIKDVDDKLKNMINLTNPKERPTIKDVDDKLKNMINLTNNMDNTYTTKDSNSSFTVLRYDDSNLSNSSNGIIWPNSLNWDFSKYESD